MQHDAARLIQAGQPLDGLLETVAIGGERRAGGARADPDHRRSVRRLQAVDEAVHGTADAEGAAEPDVRLIDNDDDQPAARGVLVRRVAGWHRHRGRTLGRLQRHPVGAHDLPRLAIDLDDEIVGVQIGDRPALRIEHTDIERGHFDRAGEPWQILRLLRGTTHARRYQCGTDEQDDATHHLCGTAR